MKRVSAAREAGRALIWLVVLVAGIFAPRAAAWAPRAAEAIYGRFFFPFAVRLLGWAARRVEWSLAEIVLLSTPLVLLIVGIVGIRRAIRHRSWRRGLGAPSGWIAAAAILVWIFQLGWGFNEARPTLAARLALPPVEPTPERLTQLARRLAREVNESHDWAVRASQLTRESPGAASCVEVSAVTACDRLDAAYEVLLPPTRSLRTSTPRRPRLLGWILPRLGLSGFYFPFTTEASVTPDLPAASALFVTAHEMAHQRGITREDEANFLAYLACRESGLPVARYGGALGAFNLVASSLVRVAPESLAALHRRALDPGPLADRAALRAYWKRKETRLEPVAHHANDVYLKASGQRAGVAAYGEAVRLLLAWEAAGMKPPE